tara:strand:+ start:2404 stop:3081 length:678 start_codon:yes stop_codon:yes gene_type:complete
MINFPEIDLKNKDIRIIIFLLLLFLFFLNNFETKTLVSILVLFVIINQYPKIKENIETNIMNRKETKPLLLNYNNKIENLFKKIKKYKKKSPYNYKEGMYYWVQFIKNTVLLEDDNLYNYNQYFDKAYYYLQRSMNLFQALGVEAKERKYIDAAKYNDFKNSKDLMEITEVVNELYQEGYSILYNLSLRLNKKWKEDPHVLNKEIVFDHPVPFDANSSKHYDYYQ